MSKRIILDPSHLDIMLKRMAIELAENHGSFEDCALVGLQPRGIALARRIKDILENELNITSVTYGELDSTF